MIKKIMEDARLYQGPNHQNMVSMKLHGTEESGCESFWVAVSHILPGGGHPMQSSPAEQVFFILEGEITLISRSGAEILKKWESIYVAPKEERQLINHTNIVATVFVIKSSGEELLKYNDEK